MKNIPLISLQNSKMSPVSKSGNIREDFGGASPNFGIKEKLFSFSYLRKQKFCGSFRNLFFAAREKGFKDFVLVLFSSSF